MVLGFLAPFVAPAMNFIGGSLGKLIGQGPPPPPPLPPPAPVPPPIPQYVPIPGPPGPAGQVVTMIHYITHKPPPDPTREPEKLTTYGIVGIVFCLIVLIGCVASGIGFYCWHQQKAEADRRVDEARDMASMESGGRRGRRRGRGSSTMFFGSTQGSSILLRTSKYHNQKYSSQGEKYTRKYFVTIPFTSI